MAKPYYYQPANIAEKKVPLPHCSIVLLLFLSCFKISAASANPSAFSECAEIDHKSRASGPLTREEKIKTLSSDFSVELSKFQQCDSENMDSNSIEQLNDSDSSSQFGSSSSDSPSSPSEEVSQGGKSKTIISSTADVSLSSNILESGENSVALTDKGGLMLENFNQDLEALSIESDLAAPPPLQGRTHETLEKSNNTQILKEQIKARAEQENDPDVKKALMRRYEEL